MATSPTPAPQPQQGQAPDQSKGGSAAGPLQLLAGITRLATALSQVVPDAADEAKAIIDAVQSASQKIMQSAGPGQTSAPGGY